MEKLLIKYPWLKVTTTIEEYVEPKYYDKLLKDYIFSGKSDLQIFEDYLKTIKEKNNLSILELGCGSGRATNILLENFKKKNIDLKLVDLSDQMLDFCQNRFNDEINAEFIKSDSIKFLEKTNNKYDIIFSLWSFSHSLHQILIEKGLENGKKYIKEIMEKMIKENMSKFSTFFLIHFDSMSDEQRILMQQWKKVFPIYHNSQIQSPSKLIIDEILQSLHKEGIIKLKMNHYTGEEIIYSTSEEALEIFFNFHMESFFNKSQNLPQIMEELLDYFNGFKDTNGNIKIKPGCFIYTVEKNE